MRATNWILFISIEIYVTEVESKLYLIETVDEENETSGVGVVKDVVSGKRRQGPLGSGGLSVDDILNKFNIFNPTENCTKALNASLTKYQETEDLITKLRFKKPFVRSTEQTDRLGRDSRLFKMMNDTIISSGCASREKLRRSGNGNSNRGPPSSSDENIGNEGGSPLSSCTVDDQYRRIDGECNNIDNRHQGSAGIAFKRFLPSSYHDEVSIPRGGFPSSSLPSARVVSVNIHHSNNPNPLTTKGISHMVMQFGEFLDHDITLTPSTELDCCNGTILDQIPDICFNINITGDTFYSGKTTCHPFTRSDGIVTDSEAREQMNGITAFIDASNVYGSDDNLAKSLRTLTDGKLKVHADGPMLPTRKQCSLETRPPALLDDDRVGGDVRAMVQPTLESIHSLFLNEHNRIADALKSKLSSFLSVKSSHEQDEMIYQESRKIVGAEMQIIVYSEFLPIILGKTEFNKHNLELSTVSQYDDKVDPSIRNEFATVAFRFGHSLILGGFNGNGGWPLRFHYFDENPVFVSGFPPNNNGRAWHSELEEASKQSCPADDLVCTKDVTNFLFAGTRGAPSNFGEDLIARNIQRGRDHGIPSYNEIRAFCGLRPLKNFDLKPNEIITDNWAKIRNVYGTGHVNDIDAFTGGLAETDPPDGLVGPTFACIIGKQFNSLKFGDRYFFNNEPGKNDHTKGLKINSRNTVRQRTLGDILCDNTNITKLQKFVMKKEDGQTNPQQDCKSRNALDFEVIASDITSNATTPAPATTPALTSPAAPTPTTTPALTSPAAPIATPTPTTTPALTSNAAPAATPTPTTTPALKSPAAPTAATPTPTTTPALTSPAAPTATPTPTTAPDLTSPAAPTVTPTPTTTPAPGSGCTYIDWNRKRCQKLKRYCNRRYSSHRRKRYNKRIRYVKNNCQRTCKC